MRLKLSPNSQKSLGRPSTSLENFKAQLREWVVRFIYRTILPFLVWLLYKAVSCTWRITLIEPEILKNNLATKTPVIFAHWHGDEILLLNLIGHYQIATISSNSIDGDMMTRIIHLMGGKTSRGSSTRGGASALKGLIRLVKSGHNSSFAVDGPKGPLHEVKAGVFELSRVLGGSIFAAGVSCDRAWQFPKSWNRTYFPKPFAKITVNWEGPIGPVPRDQDSRSPELARTLKDALHSSAAASEKKNFATGS
jgi:lysophospholipid acyltransferase (LPLAT)-like uncharacterized protein